MVGDLYHNQEASTSQAPSTWSEEQYETPPQECEDERLFAPDVPTETSTTEPSYTQGNPADIAAFIQEIEQLNTLSINPESTTMEGIQDMINLAVNAAMTTYQAQQQNQPPPPVTSGRNYKISDQNPFDGKAEHIEAFLQECENRFRVLQNDYDSVNKQVFYALSLMKNGMAKAWKDQYLTSQQGKPFLAEGDDWRNFKKALTDSFANPGKATDAIKQLQTIRQGKNSIDKLNTKFWLLVQKAGLDITNNTALLIQMYEKAINPGLFCTMVVGEKNAATLDAYMKNTSEVDHAYWRTTSVMSNTFKKNKGKGSQKQTFWPSPSSSSRVNGDTPLDVDTVVIDKTKAECYNCGKKGHYAKECRLPKKEKKGKGKQQNQNIPRMAPQGFKAHIHALMDENFDSPESSKFQEFLQSIEEGF